MRSCAVNRFQADHVQTLNRRQCLRGGSVALGAIALSQLARQPANASVRGHESLHHPPRAKRVIYLFMHGGPSQIDLFDYKPRLKDWHGEDIPPSVQGNQRLTGMTSNQKTKPLVASKFRFAQHGASGAWLSELLPHLGSVADELCILRAAHTEAINHDPAVTYLQTGHQQPGRPSMGAWLSYGL